MTLRISESEKPLDMRKSNFGCKLLFGLDRSSWGNDRTIANAFDSEKPLDLKKSMTRFGFWEENPKEWTKKEGAIGVRFKGWKKDFREMVMLRKRNMLRRRGKE